MNNGINRKIFTLIAMILMALTPICLWAEETAPTEKGLEERVDQIERKLDKVLGAQKWTERISIGGKLEAEVNWEKVDYEDPAQEDDEASDITLATAELDVDVDLGKYISGHLVFLWEEDDTEPVDIDEAFISFEWGNFGPIYLNIGKMYIPFGWFGTNMISDPITLEIGETRESSLILGLSSSGFDLKFSVFNGDIGEIGEEDDHIDNWSVSASYETPEGLLGGMVLKAGISYINNIGDSDGLEGEVVGGELRDYVEGVGLFLSLSFMEKIVLSGEYLGALDNFKSGELSFDGGTEAKPRAWNFEVAFQVLDRWQIGARYEGSDDLGGFQPEKRWGGVVNYQLFENTSLALEYLHGEFENDDERDSITAQLAVAF